MNFRIVRYGIALAGAAVMGGLAACGGGEKGGVGSESAASAARTETGPSALVYVSDEVGDSIYVIDASTDSVVEVFRAGQRPRGVRLSRDGKSLIVAVSGSPRGGPGVDESKLPPPDRSKDGIAIVDLATKEVRRLPGGNDPESFDISKDGKTIYVSNEDAGTASVVDVPSGKIITTVQVGAEPEGVETNPDGSEVWVTSEEKGTVTVINTANNKPVATITVAKRPRSVIFTLDGSKAYVPAELDSAVMVVDAKAHKVLKKIQIPGAGAKPMGSAISPNGKFVYITNGRGKTVSVIDTGVDSVVATFEVGERPWGVGVSPDGRRIYTANGPGGTISVIDAADHRVIERIPTGKSPWGIAVAGK
ncbi:MAG TPA: cytochrome D1 domain-containing protein [Gemmatimonadaceae bacterium]|nr:cytochrome D1 domain-containing protein [Gemmatimonadaceae bacterium]